MAFFKKNEYDYLLDYLDNISKVTSEAVKQAKRKTKTNISNLDLASNQNLFKDQGKTLDKPSKQAYNKEQAKILGELKYKLDLTSAQLQRSINEFEKS